MKPAKSNLSKKKPKELIMLGERIKTLRIEKGYSSYEFFAYEHSFPRTQFGRYEKGENLRFDNLLKIVKAFDMTLAEFFSEGFDS